MKSYIDYQGRTLTPNADSTIIDRRGIWAAIFDSQNRLLVSVSAYDPEFMELPGGGIDEGETPKEALIREIEEETGLVLPSLISERTFKNHVSYAAIDLDEFWDYDQEFWLVRLPHDNFFFSGKKYTQEGAYGQWIDVSEIHRQNFKHTHYDALEEFGVL